MASGIDDDASTNDEPVSSPATASQPMRSQASSSPSMNSPSMNSPYLSAQSMSAAAMQATSVNAASVNAASSSVSSATSEPVSLWVRLLLEDLPGLETATRRQVNAWLHRTGICLSADAQKRVEEELVPPAVMKGLTRVGDKGDKAFIHLLQARRYAVVTAAGIVMSKLGEGAKRASLEEAMLAHLPATGGEEFATWITTLPRGRAARPLVRALVAYHRGATLAEIATEVRAEGLPLLRDHQVGAQLLVALRYIKGRHRRFARILDDARDRLEAAMFDELVWRGIHDERDLVVVVAQAFGETAKTTGATLGASASTVKKWRMDVKDRYPFLSEYLDPPTSAFGWPLEPPA